MTTYQPVLAGGFDWDKALQTANATFVQGDTGQAYDPANANQGTYGQAGADGTPTKDGPFDRPKYDENLNLVPQTYDLGDGHVIQDPWSVQQRGIDLWKKGQEENASSFGMGSPGWAAAIVMGAAAAGGAFGGGGPVSSDSESFVAPGNVQGANATQGFASDLLPGGGVTAPTTGIPSTLGQQALTGAGLPADLGGAGSFADLTPGMLAPGGGVLAPVAGAAAAAPAVSAGTGLAPGLTLGPNGLPDAIAPALTAADSAAGGAAITGAAAPAAAGTGFLSKVGSFLNKNKDVVGSVLQGVGQGLALDAENKAQQDLLQKKHDLIAGNYQGASPSTTFRGLAPNTGGQSPDQRFGRSTAGAGGWRYEYDPSQGKIVKVADTPPTMRAPTQPTPQQAI